MNSETNATTAQEPAVQLRLKVQVNRHICTGCRICEELCPEVFRAPNGVAMVRRKWVPTDAFKSCFVAIGECPVGAISVEQ